jgi:hypothetical protein
MKNNADVTGFKFNVIWLLFVLGVSASNHMAFTSMKERERYYSFLLSRIPQGTLYNYKHYQNMLPGDYL